MQLGYDPLGRLSWTTGSPNFTRFLYDGDALVAEYDYAGTTMIKRYAHWVGQPAPAEAGVPLVSYEGASFETAMGRWLIADHQGSIIAAAHPSGATAWVNTYDEYGIPGAGNAGRFQYTGQIWLQELGMYHYKARVYSPTLGRFLQTDPVGYQDQFNLYAYVGNDPVNNTDPTGRYLCRGDRDQCAAVRQALRRLEQASRSRNLTRAERNWARTIRARYGAEGANNKVIVRFLSPQEMQRESRGAAYTKYDRATGESLITLSRDFPTQYNNYVQDQRSIGSTDSRLRRFSAQDERGNMIADEGKHAYDQQRLGRQVVPSEWHPPGQDFRSIVSRAFGSVSIQDMRDDD